MYRGVMTIKGYLATGASPSDAVNCYIQDTLFLEGKLPLYGEYSQPILSPTEKCILTLNSRKTFQI